MGRIDVLLLIHAKYRFLAKRRARKLVKILERDSKGHIEWGIIKNKPQQIDWKLVRAYVRKTEKVQYAAMKKLLEKLQLYVNMPFMPIDYLRLGWNVNDLQNDLPCFAYRIYAYFPIYRGKIGKYDEERGFTITTWKRIFGEWRVEIIKNRRNINLFKKIEDPFDKHWLPNWMVKGSFHY